jgi:biopolymer transport protein TolQ
MEPFVPPNSTGFFNVVWGLGLFAKIIVLILIIFSIISWAIIVNKYLRFRKIRRNNRFLYRLFRERSSVLDFIGIASEYPNNILSKLVFAADEEWKRIIKPNPQITNSSTEQTIIGSSEVLQLLPNINDTLLGTASLEVERLEHNLAFLAVASTASPFLGLLGTVWGILEAFLGVRHIPVVTLQIIAPGISDALVTTVAGLLVAIPAVIAYNYYVAQVRSFANDMERWSIEIVGDFRKAAVRLNSGNK